ncbi:Phosphate-specific transport system accessory protein PhoU [Caprobacter fermentans]|uniref:Phosphate-specific transport system accessory protein PhoU n=1 Tax=Caproicibacter fermentans TaxID=2576756 RepID=A0A6N8I1Z1_9FIRM|nr:phosphate signaling complex protein PhoU [Caproicibacter fermentans]MVB11543.1 Phosphate-specific transport system accessory protein PhoU [Caproicibacter fermentans]OCN02737.1 phosphate transport system regulatory protein PhoU [Clostridium sp. W14A]QNK41059.1 phosphate signaling complex protein PhoU [Caproicibacter fermentans]
MPRKIFDRELEDLISRMTEMGNAVDRKIEQTISALKTMDLELAAEVAGSDNEIDRMEHSIEKNCMELIALQQPIAGDLRIIAACLKILTDIEREADQCADICEILTVGELNTNSLATAHVVQMLETARKMFRRSMDVFLSREVEEARAVCRADDEVDSMFSKIILEVCTIITENPQNVMREVDLLFISKYAERMGDHATNIAEWVIFMETGVHPDLNEGEL